MDNGASSYRRYLDGDEEAFAQLVKAYFDNLVFFLQGYVRDLQASEDIAIDVFADLVVHRHRYDFRCSLKTYLFMLGRSRALNYIKHRSKLQFTELTEASTMEGESLEQFFLTDARRTAVHAAMDRLSPELRTVVHLVYFEDLSCEEAAKVMRKTRKQVYNLLYRAKNALRTILSEEIEL